MIRLLLAILPFLKEVIFGRDRQDYHKPPMGRFKKLVIYAVIVGSFSLNYFLFKRSITMAIEIRDGRSALEQMESLEQKLATQEAITDSLAKILGDKVRAELLKNEAEVITKEQNLQDSKDAAAVRNRPPLRPTRVRPTIVPRAPLGFGARYEFRGTFSNPDALNEKYTPPQ